MSCCSTQAPATLRSVAARLSASSVRCQHQASAWCRPGRRLVHQLPMLSPTVQRLLLYVEITFQSTFEVHYIVFSSSSSSLFWCSKASDMSINLPNTSLPRLPLPFLGQSDRRKKFPRVTSHKVSNNVFPWFNLSLRSHLNILPFSPPFPLYPPLPAVAWGSCSSPASCASLLLLPRLSRQQLQVLSSCTVFLYNRTNGSTFGSIPLFLNGSWMSLRLTY